MGISFTREQREVIEVRDRDVLVSAAAGSGKTAVLVERIVERISDRERPVDIDRLLVVTFTNAAAAEMRERIGAAVTKRLLADPENKHLQKQTTLIHNAQITTIDSFCMFVIRNNFNDIGLDPGFRVADEGELKLIRQDVMRELLEECFAKGSEEFLHCVEYFSTGSRDREIEEHILKLYEFAQSCPFPEEWLRERKKDYDIRSAAELDAAPWTALCLQQVRRTAKDCAEKLSVCLKLCERPDGPWMYGETLEKEKEQMGRLAEIASYGEGYGLFHAVSFGRLPSKKDDSVSPALRKTVQEIRKEVKAILARLNTQYFPALPETVAEYMAGSGAALRELTDLVLVYAEKLEEKKREENVIDFGDMEHLALSILVKKTPEGLAPTRTALDYRAYFEEILIDEYQDSNLVQEYLLKSISGEAEGNYNRFMVGDVKQSIYRFRLARPEIFMEKYASYTPGGEKRRRIDLHRNFRSRKEVIDSVNYIFSRIMRKELGGVEYDEEAFLRPGAAYPEPDAAGRERTAPGSRYCTELLLLPKTEEAEEAPSGAETVKREKEEDAKRSLRRKEAYAVARRIKELLGHFPVTDKSTGLLRPAVYGDIVILLRTGAGWDEEFKDVFKEEGIPSHVAGRTGYFAAREIRTLLQLLQALNNPRQDIPLFGVMRSFFGGFDDGEIARLRAGEENRDRLLYSCVKDAAQKGEEKAARFLSFVDSWRERTAYLPIHELLRGILTQTGYLNYVSALPGGEQRRANVNMLLEKAAAFEKTSYRGLFHFIRYMEQLEKYDVDYGEANILDENADLVRIMSIHKSKGLEFPICFVCGLSKPFNKRDSAGKVIADVDLGLGVDFVDTEARLQGRTLRRNMIAEKMRRDNLGEELRILYVALTRAKEKLIMTGVLDRTEALASALTQARLQTEKFLSCTDLLEANSYLDLLLPALAGHPAFDGWWGEEALPAGAACERENAPELSIRWVTEEELTAGEIKEQLDLQGARRRLLLSDPVTDTDNGLMTYMSNKFADTYEHADLAELYTKTTVSELKKAGQEEETENPLRLYEEEEVIPYIPRFMRSEEALGGAGRGSAFHRVLELLDFGALFADDFVMEDETAAQRTKRKQRTERRVREQIEAMRAEGRLSGEYARAAAPALLSVFLVSGLAGRMAAADRKGLLYREQPFVMGLSAAELSGNFPPEETVLIQGIIDVYFEEDGELVVADYKTDRVRTPEELVEKYKKQLDYYATALTRLTGKRVKEKVIYSFGLHREIML